MDNSDNPKDEKTVSKLNKRLNEERQCEFPGCNFKASALRWRDDHGEEKMVMVQLTLFKVETKVDENGKAVVDENGKRVEKREMVEALEGKGVRPVVLHYTHANTLLRTVNKARSEGLPLVYEVVTLEEAIRYQFDKEAREQSFAKKVEYWKALDGNYGKKPSDRKVAEPAPKSSENQGGNPIELCGMPVGSAHGWVIRYYINSQNEVVGLCGGCVAAYFKAEPERVKICRDREKAEEIAASKKERAEQRKADEEAAEREKARLEKQFGDPMARGWRVRKPERAERDPKMPDGKKSQRRQDIFKDEADTSKTEKAEPEPAKEEAETSSETQLPVTTEQIGSIIAKNPEKGLEAVKQAVAQRQKELKRSRPRNPERVATRKAEMNAGEALIAKLDAQSR